MLGLPPLLGTSGTQPGKGFMQASGGTQVFSRLVKDVREAPSTITSLPIGLDRLTEWSLGLRHAAQR